MKNLMRFHMLLEIVLVIIGLIEIWLHFVK